MAENVTPRNTGKVDNINVSIVTWTHQDKVRHVTKACNSYLISNFGVGWDDLADCTSVWDWIEDDFPIDDKKAIDRIVLDIVWDKLDLDGTIYMSMTHGQLSERIYGVEGDDDGETPEDEE